MTPELEPPPSAEDVAGAARLAGLRLPAEDLEPLADALAAHRAFVAPLLAEDLSQAGPAPAFDPRWRG